MSLALEKEAPPLNQDESGAIRVGGSKVLLELVVRAFQDGAAPETIAQRYPTLALGDIYAVIGYYLRHQDDIQVYLKEREQKATEVQQRLSSIQPNLSQIRERLLAQE